MKRWLWSGAVGLSACVGAPPPPPGAMEAVSSESTVTPVGSTSMLVGSTSTLDGSTSEVTVGETSTTTEQTTGGTEAMPGSCLAPPPPPGTVCHSAEVLKLPNGCIPRPVLLTDLDHDSYGDVLVGCSGGDLLLALGGPGGLGEWDALGWAGTLPQDIAVAQLDGEGGDDIVLINNIDNVFTSPLQVFYRGDDGSITDIADFDPGANPNRVAIGSWSQQELPDIVVALSDANVVSVLRSDGGGGYSVGPGFPVADPISDLAMADFDGRSGIDIAVVSESGGVVTVLFNSGGGFAGEESTFPDNPGAMPNRVLLTDVEPNGTVDILTTRGGPGMSGVRLLWGTGSGDFKSSGLVLGEELRGLGAGDLDGNGLPDIALADRGAEVVIFLMAIGDGTIAESLPLDVGGPPWSISTGDIDGDGLTDVVVSVEQTNEIVVLRNSQ